MANAEKDDLDRSALEEIVALSRACLAEAIGTFILLAAIVGSGIMGDTLSDGNDGVALLANSVATGAILVVLILSLGPISGAHFNPAVTFAFWLNGKIGLMRGLLFIGVQVVSAILGVIVAHLMFDLDPITLGTHTRTGMGNWIGEAIASFALVFTIFACVRTRPDVVPYAVGLVIVAGYWYTASTSFANPAVTLARSFTDSFASIRPEDVPHFVFLQFVFAAIAVLVAVFLYPQEDD